MEAAVSKNITFFMIGKLTAVLGSSIYGFAIGLYILQITGSSFNFAITLLLSALPRILLSPFAGTISDRLDRKKIIIFSDFACAIWLCFIFIIFQFVLSEIWVLYTAAAVLSILNTFYSSGVTSSIYNMVGPDYLQKAMSLNQAATSLSSILGPVLGGVFFGIFPITTFMLINIAAFTVSGIASMMIQYNLYAEKRDRLIKSSVLSDLKQGISFVNTKPFILNLIVFSIWLNFWFAVFPVALPYLVLTVRGMEAYQLGIIEGAFSVGMLVLAVFLSSRPEIKNKKRAIIGGLTAMSVVLILIGIPSVPFLAQLGNQLIFVYLSVMALLLSSFIMVINMPIMVLLQKQTPDEYRGRVMSLMETGASAMAPLGYILFGALLEKLPVWVLLFICGGSILLLIAYHLRKKTFIQHLREADAPASAAELQA